MSFPRYQEYKDSGVEWLGNVPRHWDVCTLRRIVSMQSGESITSETIDETGDFPVFGGNGLRGYTSNFTHDGHYVLIGRQGALCGNVNYASGKFWASEHAVVVTPVKQIETLWLGEMLRAMNLNQYSVAAAQPGLSVDLVGRISICVPPLHEQTKIAAFLDDEIAKIDALVAEQRRLMALLKEKRQAVISNAVTRGLNPHAPLKASGIEWLGDMPEHWEVNRLRRIISTPLSNGIFKKKDAFGSGALLINVFDIYRQNFKVDFGSLERVQCDSSELLNYEVFPGDLFFVRSSLKQEGIAVVAMADRCSEAVVFECHLIRARPNPKVLSGRFASYVLNSTVYRSTMIAKAKITTMTTIDQEAILSTNLPIPPITEQIQIADFIDTELAKFDTLTTEAQRAIDLLHERRTALISAAVTGQIDVRQT